jgi:raffinose/stachyose/melibiose transport system permease protein
MHRRKGDNVFAAVFMAPGAAFYIVFMIIPVFFTLYYSLNQWDGVGSKIFLWFDNFIELAQDKNYWTAARNNFILMGLAFIIQEPIGFILAFLISRTAKGYRFYRAAFFLPVVIAPAATGLMFHVFLNSEIGPVNHILDFVGLGILKRNWLSDKSVVIFSVALPQVWQYLGINFAIFLAAIQSIPEDTIESAQLDGASNWQLITRIILPQMREVIQILVIFTFTGCLKAFDISWIMTWGGPGHASSYLALYMYRTSFKESLFGYGSSIVSTILLFSLAFTVAFRALFQRIQNR